MKLASYESTFDTKYELNPYLIYIPLIQVVISIC